MIGRVYTGGGAGPLSNELTGRSGVPRGLAVVKVEATPRPTTRAQWQVGKLPHPKAGLTNSPDEMVLGDPIVQLNRTRNAALPNAELVHQVKHPAKAGDMEGVGDKMPIRREAENSRRRRQLALAGVRREHLGNTRTRVVLGTTGSGLDFYRNSRIRPALPGGREEVPTITPSLGKRGSSYLHSTMPEFALRRLEAERVTAPPVTRPAKPAGGMRVDITPVQVASASRVALISGDDTAPESAGRFTFMLAALLVAWLVLK
jgi:hypothetical protein